MKKVIITQSNYIPWKGYFDAINMVDEVILYDDMQYTRRDWRNRNKIKTSNGLLWLTIPVDVKGKYYQKINETHVSDPAWREHHWKTLVQSYSKAPFFKMYKEQVEALYLGSTETNLSMINESFLKEICKLLAIDTPMRQSSEFKLAEGKTERLVDLCKQVGASDYYSGPAAKDYMDESLFANEGIRVHYFDYSGYPSYPQLHGDFEHGVSVLDLLFNVGSDFRNYFKSY